jgi:hypothetical protein
VSATVTPAPPARWALVCHHDSGRVEWTYWPTREQAEEADRELAPCALICHSDSGRIEATFWDSRAQATDARDTLAPCGPRCIGVHTIVNADPPPARGRHPVFSGRP